MDDRTDDTTARNRWMVITASRFAGAVMAALGLLIVSGRFELPSPVGYVLLAVGLIEAFVVPNLLARRWRTPDQ